MRGKIFFIGLRALAIFAVTLLVSSTWAATNWREKVLHSFSGGDGARPGGLISDAVGNLYGTTGPGGDYGYGTVFELTPDGSGGWTETVLYSFCSQTGCTDGANPSEGLTFDAAGNLYGTTWAGGTGSGTDCTIFGGGGGCGTVFELTPIGGGYWAETVLYSFCPQGGFCTDGQEPNGSLIFDAAGNLYGTTYGTIYGGTAFKLSPNQGGGWTETVLHAFGYSNGYADGYYPAAGLIFNVAGNLYGTTSYGGDYGYGTAFELSPAAGGSWTEAVLHSFSWSPDGGYPEASLILDAAGNLYGTTSAGGTYTHGMVFELKPTRGWTETLLYSFNPNNGTDGSGPSAGLIFDAAGNLYGMTGEGGAYGVGTVFEMTPTAGGGWTEQVLRSFGNGADGAYPSGGLIFDAAGNLYGTTVLGGAYSQGTVFELTPVYPCAKCSHAVLQ